ncbi:MAG: hypothetical protein NVSMB1_21680 [Polyangiales bacterium]
MALLFLNASSARRIAVLVESARKAITRARRVTTFFASGRGQEANRDLYEASQFLERAHRELGGDS